MSVAKRSIRATDLGEFIRYKSCERRFKLGFNNRELAKQLPFAGRLFASLDPILQESGKKREQEWENYLRKQNFLDLSTYSERPEKSRALAWADFVAMLQELRPRRNAFVRELAIAGELGAFHVEGRVDFAVIIWRGSRPKLRLVECKASRKDQTYHRAQLAIYKLIVEALLTEQELEVGASKLGKDDIECVVARIDEETNRNQALLEIPPFDLSMIEQDVRRLLVDEGPLSNILGRSLDELSYQLESKCDDCIFNVHCLPESGRQRKLQLLACDPSTVRALEAEGIDNLDKLAQIDLTSETAERISKSSNFSGSLQYLKARANARLSSLPDPPEKSYPVQFLSYRVFSQLPEHDILGQRLLRIYLCVNYDYTENRLASLAAHVTASDGLLHTGWIKENGKNTPDPVPKERVPTDNKDNPYEERALQGVDVVHMVEKPWTGVYEWDSVTERKMLEDFFQDLVKAIKQAAGKRKHAPLHFYVWSRTEISKLIEACSRASSDLLGPVQQLLGCRESLEQLIYSVLQTEVNNRFGLAWTGRGLLVASSLSWYGWTYHWQRIVNGESVRIDRDFHQDLFDFKEDLFFANGEWLSESNQNSPRHRFEIRTQFNDNLPAGYLHGYWGKLPEKIESSKRNNAQKAIDNYKTAEKPDYLKEYLRARAHALRWLEERIDKKSSAIQKPPIILSSLPEFSLQVNHPARACIDFLRLDFHIKFTDWLAQHLLSPLERIGSGRTIPVRNVKAENGRLIADIDLTGYGIGIDDLAARSTYEVGSFVRLSPCFEDPGVSQTLAQFGRGGITCTIKRLDWDNAVVEMSSISVKEADRYKLSSRRIDPAINSLIFAHATIDENPSDFVSMRVEQRLEGKRGTHALAWFDRIQPRVPAAKQLTDMQLLGLKRLCKNFKADGTNPLAVDQRQAIITGLQSTVQLIQGPPGTGKTMTTAAAILTRILAQKDKQMTVLVSANTHTAINTLLERIAAIEPSFRKDADDLELKLLQLCVLKVGESHSGENNPEGVKVIPSDERMWPNILTARKNGIAIIGGTVNNLLKLAKDAPEMHADLLIVDEASMMVFPHFLAIATLVRESGRIMLAGDHRQLSPILAHDWEREDRPPTVLYQPYSSAYDAVKDLCAVAAPEQISMSALTVTYRLPDEIRLLIARLYKLDAVELEGKPGGAGIQPASKPGSAELPQPGSAAFQAASNLLSTIWQSKTGLYLITHNERESRQSNLLEAEIIEKILSVASLPDKSVAIVTPHRAQRTLLNTKLKSFDKPVDLIDTVERLQGGERPNIIFSATVSDPAAIASSVEFILDLNRSNVAFSRAKQRLIVVCSESLINYVPAALDQYDETLLWKSLREVCNTQLGQTTIGPHSIKICCPARPAQK